MYVYIEGEEDPLKQYRLIPDASPAGGGWKFESGDPPFRVSKESAPYPNFPNGEWVPNRTDPVWMPGGFLTISANGSADGTGIVWVAMPFAANGNPAVVRGVLRAFNASDVSTGELWDSENTGNDNDRLGQFAKFCPPVVANGKVYVATFQQETILEDGRHIQTPDGDQPSLVIYGPRNLITQ
jgi:outer membrane protein assembly factor BamB